MKSFSKTKQLLTLHTLILLVVVGAYVFLTLHINEKKELASKALSNIELIHNQNDQLQDLNIVLRDINEDQEKLNSYFVHSDKIVNFLETVEQIGRDSGAVVEVRSLSEEETRNSEINVLTLNLTAKGDWESVYHFLVLIQNFPIKSTFDKIHMSSSEIDGDILWSSVLNMRVLELKK